MFKRHLIILTLTLLAFAATAQLPGANSSKYQKQATVQKSTAKQQSDTTAPKTAIYCRGALGDFMRVAQQVVDQQKADENNFENQIFVISQEMVTENDNQVGAKMQFFNCFRKPIKMIDIYFISYNEVGEEQKDGYGVGSMTVRCVGRINPAAKAETIFPKLFWNKDKEIQYLLVAKIVFTFFDNSTAAYNGIDEVLKHYK